MKLHPQWQRHTGHCQVTYISKNKHGERLVYCLQDNGPRHGGVRLMRCTQNCEPVYPVSFTQVRATFELPEQTDKLTELCIAWINKYHAGGAE